VKKFCEVSPEKQQQLYNEVHLET